MHLKNPNLLTCFCCFLFLFVDGNFLFSATPSATSPSFHYFPYELKTTIYQQQPPAFNRGIFVEHYFDYFTMPYSLRRHVLTFGYKHNFNFGEVIPKINIGQNVSSGESFLSSPGAQVELDAYPVIDPSSYLYLNAGFSASDIFPSQRYGFEYFRSIGTWETSLGMRYLKWDDDIFLLTGSLAKYLSAWWISFRPYIALASDALKDSYHLTVRRYFNPHREYFYIIFSSGDSPDQPVYLIESFGNFNSTKIQVGIIKSIFDQIIGKIGIGFQYEEFERNNFRDRFEATIGLEYRF